MPRLDIFWSMLEFFLWVIWIWILIMVFIDIFRSHDLGGFAKALWFLFVLFIPLIGVLVYLIARGARCTSMRSGRLSSRTGNSGPMSRTRRDRRVPRTSWLSWPTCASGERSPPMSSRARRPRFCQPDGWLSGAVRCCWPGRPRLRGNLARLNRRQ